MSHTTSVFIILYIVIASHLNARIAIHCTYSNAPPISVLNDSPEDSTGVKIRGIS